MSIRDALIPLIPPITITHPCNQFSITITIIEKWRNRLQITDYDYNRDFPCSRVLWANDKE